jgi:hypothetical protein
MNRLPLLLLASVLALSVALVPASIAGSPKQVAVFQMFDEPKIKPDRWFFAANSSPYLDQLRWEKWGKKRTTATGIYVQDCASCGEEIRRPAILKFWRIRACPKHDMRAYTRGRLVIVNDDGSKREVGPQNPDYRLFCK